MKKFACLVICDSLELLPWKNFLLSKSSWKIFSPKRSSLKMLQELQEVFFTLQNFLVLFKFLFLQVSEWERERKTEEILRKYIYRKFFFILFIGPQQYRRTIQKTNKEGTRRRNKLSWFHFFFFSLSFYFVGCLINIAMGCFFD